MCGGGEGAKIVGELNQMIKIVGYGFGLNQVFFRGDAKSDGKIAPPPQSDVKSVGAKSDVKNGEAISDVKRGGN